MLLTLIVPTYNRADCLEALLKALVTELRGLEDQVRVIVGDNASVDRTPMLTAAFYDAYRSCEVLRHASNLGADENFCHCVEKVDTRYFWIMGDDDLPKAGVIRLLVDLLRRETPDLVFLGAESREVLNGHEPDRPVTALAPVRVSRMAFARKVHVNATFISTMVVNRETYRSSADPAPLRRFTGTSLVQLGWVFGVLRTGSRFMYLNPKCVLSMRGNSGGYAMLKVFGQNFAAIVEKAFGAEAGISRAIIRRCAIMHLPGVVWGLRFDRIGDFDYEEPSSTLRPQLHSFLSYWLLLVPISSLPKLLAWFPLKIARGLSMAITLQDRSLEWFGRAIQR